MRYHVDIRLRPDPEFPAHQLMSALFSTLHRTLSRAQTTTVGVSFPGYGVSPATVGETLRLIGLAADLDLLSDASWLSGLRDHTRLTPMKPVPTTAEARSLRRVQAKSNPERLLRRQLRRHAVAETEVRAKYEGLRGEQLRLPFISLASSSTGQPFKLFLKLGPAEESSQAGSFNAYGLSQTATIPWF
jgi:CRISPR-associated endonuclease Csy4